MSWEIVPVYQDGRIYLALQPVEPPKHVEIQEDIDGARRVVEMDVIPKEENETRVIITDI